MLRRAALSLTLFVTFSGQSTWAEPPPKSGRAGISLAMELLDVTHAKANLINMEGLLEPTALDWIRKAHPGLDPATFDAFRGALHEEFQASMNDLVAQIAQIYVRHFSDAELRTVLAFYKTDTGKKLLSEMPAVMKESAIFGQAWGREVGELAEQRAIARLRNKGIKI